jgi:hypothetical protein
MTKYNTFLCFFILAVIAMIVFFVFYLQTIFSFAFNLNDMDRVHPNPFEFLSRIFTPPVIISGIILGLASLTYRILGIVHVAKNKTAKDGEKALWIVGFIIMGFVTAIVFLVMAKGRKFV